MRVVFYSLSPLTRNTAKKFIEEDHDVIIVEADEKKVKEAGELMDCGFIVGDASHPATLKEVNPKQVDLFLALSESDQDNLVACLIARSLGIERTILQVKDADYKEIAQQLELKEVIIPSQIASQYLIDAVLNENLMELFQIMKNRAGLFLLVAKEENEGKMSELKLPADVRSICYFRDEKFHFYEEDDIIKKGDEIVLLAEQEDMKKVLARWNNKNNR